MWKISSFEVSMRELAHVVMQLLTQKGYTLLLSPWSKEGVVARGKTSIKSPSET